MANLSPSQEPTDRVVECAPFGVDDHLAAVFAYWYVAEFGDVLNLLDISTVRSCAKD